jgi:hypothetical protein
MKTVRYILLVLVVLTCSVTAYGSSKISISISFQPARQPVYVYPQPVVYSSCSQPVYVCQQPVYVNPAPVYAHPKVGFSFSWGGDRHSYVPNYHDGRRSFHGDRFGGRAHR